jgi:hypothetical protein
MPNLTDLFNVYGYTDKLQQQALLKLLYLSGAFDPKTLAKDLAAVGYKPEIIEAAISVARQACSDKFDKKDITTFNAELILQKLLPNSFTTEKNGAWPEQMNHWLIRFTQREWFRRKITPPPAATNAEPEKRVAQERWEINVGEWLDPKKDGALYADAIKQCLAELGVEKAVMPQKKKYAGIIVQGARRIYIEERLNFAKMLVEREQIDVAKLYLLRAERNFSPDTADKRIDGDESYKKLVAEYFAIKPEQVTEIQLMEYCFFKIKGEGKFASISVANVDVVKADGPLNTLTGARKFLSREEVQKTSGDYLFLSNAPHIAGQSEDVATAAREKLPNLQWEMAGPEARAVAIEETINAVAARLYGGYVRVAKTMGCTEEPGYFEGNKKTLSFEQQKAQMEKEFSLQSSMPK